MYINNDLMIVDNNNHMKRFWTVIGAKIAARKLSKQQNIDYVAILTIRSGYWKIKNIVVSLVVKDSIYKDGYKMFNSDGTLNKVTKALMEAENNITFKK